MKNLLFIFIFATNIMMGQVIIDTSYTPISTFNKEKSKFPFIKIVNRKTDKSVRCKKDIVYKIFNNRQLHLDFYYNKKKKRQPAVILIHGGGWKSGNKNQMQYLAQEIAKKGYSCFSVEYRLSNEAVYPAGVLDVKAAIKYIKTNALQYNVDVDKVAVLGCSSGGQMAALVGTTNQNNLFEDGGSNAINSSVQAIIDMDGILAFHHPESQEGKIASVWLGGTYEEKPQVWQQASALTHCDKNTPPILFINSEMARFHAGRADMIAILNQFEIYNEVQTIHNSPHSFWFFEPWFDEIVKYSTVFLDKIFGHSNLKRL